MITKFLKLIFFISWPLVNLAQSYGCVGEKFVLKKIPEELKLKLQSLSQRECLYQIQNVKMVQGKLYWKISNKEFLEPRLSPRRLEFQKNNSPYDVEYYSIIGKKTKWKISNYKYLVKPTETEVMPIKRSIASAGPITKMPQLKFSQTLKLITSYRKISRSDNDSNVRAITLAGPNLGFSYGGDYQISQNLGAFLESQIINHSYQIASNQDLKNANSTSGKAKLGIQYQFGNFSKASASVGYVAEHLLKREDAESLAIETFHGIFFDGGMKFASSFNDYGNIGFGINYGLLSPQKTDDQAFELSPFFGIEVFWNKKVKSWKFVNSLKYQKLTLGEEDGDQATIDLGVIMGISKSF